MPSFGSVIMQERQRRQTEAQEEGKQGKHLESVLHTMCNQHSLANTGVMCYVCVNREVQKSRLEEKN